MANARKLTAEKLKSCVKESFEHIRKALDIREKLLLRQIDVLSSHSHKIPSIDQIKFETDNEANVLNSIRVFGKFNLDGFNLSNNDSFTIEDYICPNIDHDLMYKCLNETQQKTTTVGAGEKQEEQIVIAFANSKSLITENIVNNILNSKELIENKPQQQNQQPPSPPPPQQQQQQQWSLHDDDDAAARKLITTSQASQTDDKKKLKSKNITLNNCKGTFNIKNLTIGQNCGKGVAKTLNDEDDESDTGVTCEFYNRLMNEIKNSFVQKSNEENTPVTDHRNSSISYLSDSSESAQCASGQLNEALIKKFDNLKLNIPSESESSPDSSNHPVQIEQWLKQIICETEVEPIQNTEILEHSHIHSP